MQILISVIRDRYPHYTDARQSLERSICHYFMEPNQLTMQLDPEGITWQK